MIFDNATIITMNPKRQIIANGALAVTDKKIAAAGKSKDIAGLYPEKQRIDCNGGILMPGLIDTHVHLAQCMLRGVSDGPDIQDLFDWLTRYIWPLQGSYTAEDGLASASLCVLEMIKSGTTGFIEVLLAETYGIDGIAEMCVQSGIRAALGKVVMDMTREDRDKIGMHPGMWEPRQRSIANTLAAYDRWNGAGDGRLQIWFGARTPSPVINPTLYAEIGKLAAERDMGITIHSSEDPQANDYTISQGYHSPTDFAHAHGVLGGRTVLAHYNYTDSQDWEQVVSAGASVSHNPASNAKSGWKTAPMRKMMEAGVNAALGCDGGPVNNTMDLIRDLRMVSCVARMREMDENLMPAETVLEMATLNGARAMGIEDRVGSIEEGKQADFIIIDVDKPHLTPMWDPAAAVVFVRGRYRDVARRAGVDQYGPGWPWE